MAYPPPSTDIRRHHTCRLFKKRKNQQTCHLAVLEAGYVTSKCWWTMLLSEWVRVPSFLYLMTNSSRSSLAFRGIAPVCFHLHIVFTQVPAPSHGCVLMAPARLIQGSPATVWVHFVKQTNNQTNKTATRSPWNDSLSKQGCILRCWGFEGQLIFKGDTT